MDAGVGVRAVVIVPTRELAHQIHNECLKLAQGRKWKVVLFSKATANALSHKEARDKVGMHLLNLPPLFALRETKPKQIL